ncbi:Ribulose-1,5 bisphosphate carboxylase/oxygenase large subunit N-methyltransferase, chloroplastic [Morella rubra]|uniref:Ribulose-1,5 bisphosphate carboxylase/oxygenase large subunit N-methyltransferase, chloroplastic n=1 Tax=Morella rubra TaxID=262757 RepID=A0A6A1WB20_9ROSI|nr:Ribulose-1,5 bisphosphate carboxylase/oxygenase large subunit N-methyltransferase, chloroplastic [Morella rubra]
MTFENFFPPKSAAPFVFNPDAVVALEIGSVCGELKPWVSVALYLIREKLKNDSSWRHYLEILPESMDSTIFCAGQKRNWLNFKPHLSGPGYPAGLLEPNACKEKTVGPSLVIEAGLLGDPAQRGSNLGSDPVPWGCHPANPQRPRSAQMAKRESPTPSRAAAHSPVTSEAGGACPGHPAPEPIPVALPMACFGSVGLPEVLEQPNVVTLPTDIADAPIEGVVTLSLGVGKSLELDFMLEGRASLEVAEVALPPHSALEVGLEGHSVGAVGPGSPVGVGALCLESLEPSRCAAKGGELVAVDYGESEFIAKPLRMLLPTQELEVGEGSGVTSSWVLDMVASFRQLVGVSCEGHEADLVQLFAAFEKERGTGGNTDVRSGGKLVRELKALESSVNYETNVYSSRKE